MTRFVGIEPVGLIGLADTADQYAQRLALATAAVEPVLRHLRSTHALDAAATKRFLLYQSGELRWRAKVITSGELPRQGGLPQFAGNDLLREYAATAVFSVDTWSTEFDQWAGSKWLRQLQQRSPAIVAEAFAEVGIDRARVLASRHPQLVGALDGAPAEVRYLANRHLIAIEIANLEKLQRGLRSAVGEHLPSHVGLRKIEERVARYRQWLDERRQILLFDPRGDGRVAEVFGDLDAATSVAVLVPGMANEIHNFSTQEGGFRSHAAVLYEAAYAPSTATVAWLGYDTPDGVDAVSRSAAEEAAPALSQFVAGIDPGSERAVTVIAHSYGSVVAGMAAADGLEADNLVFLGSPGTTLGHADEASLREGAQVWVALASGDPIGMGVDPGLRWWHALHPVLPLLAVAKTVATRDNLWHGVNPTDSDFGAHRIATTGSSGHSSYYEATTLDNLALILDGRHAEVEYEAERP